MFHAAMATELQRWKDALPASLHVDTSQDWRAGNNSDKKLYLPMVLQLQYVCPLSSSPRSPAPPPPPLMKSAPG